MGSEAELEGAYRLMNNKRVTMEALHASHVRETASRASEHKVVLAISDTTPCEFAHADPEDVGYLNTGKAGFYLHYTLIVAADELRPLGVSYMEPVFRHTRPRKLKKSVATKRSAFDLRKKENRESERWQRGIDASDEALSGCQVIHVADRESDIYELMSNAIKAGRRFVFRARIAQRKGLDEEGTEGPVWDLAAASEGALQREVPLSSRKPRVQTTRGRKTHPPRHARLATLDFSGTPLELVRPRYLPAGEFDKTIPVHVVRVWEAAPPEGETPVEWLLYTTEPIGTPEEIASVVDIYRARWLIEECNKALKTGCLIEHRQFESREALLNIIALSLPIAVEILALRSAARRTPDKPATHVMSPLRIELLRRLSARPLPEHPTVAEALWALAGFGGHQKTNGEPGWLILHRAMRKLIDYEVGYIAGLRDAAERGAKGGDLSSVDRRRRKRTSTYDHHDDNEEAEARLALDSRMRLGQLVRMTRMFNKERLDATDHALRLVLLAALDRNEALCCLEGEGAAGACRWPSGVYTALSHAALASPWVWCRCRARLDDALADQLHLHGAASPAELAERFHDGRDVVSSRELAGMLWSLLRRPELYQESLLRRLSAEFEVAVFAGCIPGRGTATTGPTVGAH